MIPNGPGRFPEQKANKMKTNIIIKGIEKESEKAYCLVCLVSYNANAPKERNVWFPKSVCNIVNNGVAAVEDWFVEKMRNDNAFHGYRMNFETI